MKLCSATNCDRPVYARGVCQYHYQLARRAKPITNPRLIDQNAYYRGLSPGRPRVEDDKRKTPATVIFVPEQLAWANAQPGGRSKAIRAALTMAMHEQAEDALRGRTVPFEDKTDSGLTITQAETDHALETAVTVTDENSFD